VFIDETAVTTKMVRHRGRSPRGERLVASVPHGHWKTLTLVAALRITGLTAPYVIDGAMDGPSFLAYVEQVLAPTLRKRDIVFMDNLRTHKIDGVREAIEAVGAKVRYLPLKTSRGVVGVLGVQPHDTTKHLTAEQRRLMEAFANQTALAIERAQSAAALAGRLAATVGSKTALEKELS